jgi:hypothetical protein
MSAPGKLVRSSRWKTGPSKGQRPLGSDCCVVTGDGGLEAYTAIAQGVGLSHERSDIAGNSRNRHVSWIMPRRTRALPDRAIPFSRFVPPLRSGEPVSPP